MDRVVSFTGVNFEARFGTYAGNQIDYDLRCFKRSGLVPRPGSKRFHSLLFMIAFAIFSAFCVAFAVGFYCWLERNRRSQTSRRWMIGVLNVDVLTPLIVL
jgi:hypothetical protein